MFCTSHAVLAMPKLLAAAEEQQGGGTHHSLLPSHSFLGSKLLASLAFSNACYKSAVCFKGFVLSCWVRSL